MSIKRGTMNIWIFNHYATYRDYPGGTRHFDFSKYLVSKGHKVVIFASSFHYLLLKETRNFPKNSFFIKETIENIDFVWIKTPPYQKSDYKRVINMLVYSFRSYFSALKLFNESVISKPDVIIGSSVHPFAALTAYFLSKRFSVPFILEIRDIWPQSLIDLGVSKYHPFILILKIIEKFLYNKANKIISLLPYFEDYLRENFPQKVSLLNKVVYIPNGVDLERIKQLLRNENLIKGKDNFINIVYAGSMGMVNDIYALAEIAKKIRENFTNVKLHVVGGGYYKERFFKDLSKFENVVFFYDPLPKNEVYKFLSSFDIFLFHIADIFNYGISCNKLFDYIALGKPIIFYANVKNDIVKQLSIGITVSNTDGVIEAIREIASWDEEKLLEVYEKSQEYIKNYSTSVLAQNLENVILNAYKDYYT
jgi:glycosyltransferase involved in cell wall biosynthesis